MASGAAGAIIVIVMGLLIGAVTLVMLFTYNKSNRLVVRSPDSNRILGYYWMIEKKDKEDGTIWWKSAFFHKSIKMPEPPDECIDINRRGKSWVEVWRLNDDEYVYGNGNQLKFEVKDNKKFVIYERDGKKVKELLEPFTKVQRQVVVQEFAKAEAMRKNSWLKENVMNLAALSAMLIIIVVGLVYWGDIAKYTLEKDASSSGLIKEANFLVEQIRGDTKTIRAGVSEDAIVQPTEDPPIEPPK